MKLKDLIIGEIYLIQDGTVTYNVAYCGLSTLNLPMVELMTHPLGIDGMYKPTNWNPIGTNTYWSYRFIHMELSETKQKIRNDKLKKLGINDE